MMLAGILFALAASLFWASAVFPFTITSAQIGSSITNEYRLFVSIIIILILVYYFNQFNFSINFFTYQTIIPLCISGIVGLAIGDLLSFKSYSIIGNQLSTSLLMGSPILAYILAVIFLNESIAIYDIIAIVFSSIGIIVLSTDKSKNKIKHTNKRKGILMALTAMALQAIGIVLVKYTYQINNTILPIEVVLIRYTMGFGFGMIINILTKRLTNIFFEIINAKINFHSLIILAATLNIIGGVFAVLSVKNINPAISQAILCFEPIWIAIGNYLLYKKHISKRNLLGISIALIGLLLLSLKSS